MLSWVFSQSGASLLLECLTIEPTWIGRGVRDQKSDVASELAPCQILSITIAPPVLVVVLITRRTTACELSLSISHLVIASL